MVTQTHESTPSTQAQPAVNDATAPAPAPMTMDRLTVIRATIQAAHAADYARAAGSKDILAEFGKLAALIEAETRTAYDAELADAKKQADAQTALVNAFTGHIVTGFNDVWQANLDAAKSLPAKIHGIIFTVSRKDDGSWNLGVVSKAVEVKVIATGQTKDTSSTATASASTEGKGKGKVMVVDGHTYPSAMAAYKALLPAKYASNKNANRDSIGSLLLSAGHKMQGSKATHWE